MDVDSAEATVDPPAGPAGRAKEADAPAAGSVTPVSGARPDIPMTPLSEEGKQLSQQSQSTALTGDEGSGYYMLKGEEFEVVVRNQFLLLGRVKTATAGTLVDGDTFSLGSNKNMSREAAWIKWNAAKGKWELTIVGKTHIEVNKKVYSPSSQTSPIPLKSKTPIKIGDIRFFFLLPK